MPSPFPGMDPYLEHPAHWRGVHTTLVVALQKVLTPLLRPRYTAWVEERVYLAPDNDPATEPVVVTTLREEEIRERHLEVRATDTRDLVAVIEVVSPSNKVPGSAGSASFNAKRREVTSSPAHWIEIDLLRQGSTLDVRKRLVPHEYCVHVSPADRRPSGRVWPICLVDPLPVVEIPLRGTDQPAPLDLRAALDLVYDDAGYDLKLDYRRKPVPPLSAELAAWADALLRKKKLR